MNSYARAQIIYVFIWAKNKPKHLCQVRYCRRKRDLHNGGRACDRCRQRRWRSLNPLRNTYNHLKSSAQRRGIEFALTLDEFYTFCKANGFTAYRKSYDDAQLTFDRKDVTKGYSLDNLQLITHLDNSVKSNYEKAVARIVQKNHTKNQPTPDAYSDVDLSDPPPAPDLDDDNEPF